MSSFLQDVAVVLAPAGVVSTVAVSALAARWRGQLLRRETQQHEQARKLEVLQQQVKDLELRYGDVQAQVAARDAEAGHLAEVRLPELVSAVMHGGEVSVGGLLHPSLAGTPTDQAFQAVLEQVQAMSRASSDQAEEAARTAVKAITRAVQALVYGQQGAINRLLDQEHDEHVLELVLPIDHAASQLARRLQVLGVLTGTWPGRQRDAASLLEVIRGGVSRISDYTRVQVPQESAYYVASRYVEPVVLAVAELLDNAARHSAPSTPVEVSVLEAHHGITIRIDDAGTSMPPEMREEAEMRLAGQRPFRLTQLGALPSIGLFGVGTLATRYGFRASLTESVHGGVRAMVHLPRGLLAEPPLQQDPAAKPAAPDVQPPARPSATPVPPGADQSSQKYAKASDGLPVRRRAPARPAAAAPTVAAPPEPTPEVGRAVSEFVRGNQSARDKESS